MHGDTYPLDVVNYWGHIGLYRDDDILGFFRENGFDSKRFSNGTRIESIETVAADTLRVHFRCPGDRDLLLYKYLIFVTIQKRRYAAGEDFRSLDQQWCFRFAPKSGDRDDNLKRVVTPFCLKCYGWNSCYVSSAHGDNKHFCTTERSEFQFDHGMIERLMMLRGCANCGGPHNTHSLDCPKNPYGSTINDGDKDGKLMVRFI